MRSRNDAYSGEKFQEVVYTIEHHLKRYAELEDTTERHQVLWHAWNQNKRWLSQLLEWTLHSFPNYSYHNATHADAVLHNIERILGEKRIRQLSASDCFMLLHAAYMHDIGMSISAPEREEMMKDDNFTELVEYLEREGDMDMKKSAESVMQTEYVAYQDASTRERPRKLKDLFRQKLDVYYGLSQIMAEYQRRQHAKKVKDRMHQWTMQADQLGNGFSVSGIPLRIFLRIADCASIHTVSGIEPILELPKEDSGYVLDMVHPRFVAVMLQLGDALDMDNDRFNPFIFQFAGNFPRTSKLHFEKHQAIRQLKITPEAIQIQADCHSQEVLRLVRMECEGIEEILKNASYYWADICPPELPGCLPTLNQSIILLEGQQVPAELVKAQFNISQVRAFRLLEGANVYGGKFVFLRELIQNAIDASKLQCWEDYIYRCKLKERKILQDDYEMVEYGLNASEKEVLSEIDVWDYPIELYFEIGIQIRNEKEEIEFVPIDKVTPEQEKKGQHGIRFMVRDHGTGISKDDLIKISNVGSSYEQKKHSIDKMPDWLKPTGQFGIGLQSVFLVSDFVTAKTYTRSGEKYEITFNKVSNGSGGYINVKPLLPDDYVTFGTTFEIFLHNDNKRLHAECWEAWNTESEDADRFVSDYDKKRPLRHSQEMLAQMILYIDEMLGENLFPICACIKGKGCDEKHYNFIKKSVTKLVLDADAIEKKEGLDKEQYISWLFKAIRPQKLPVLNEDNRKLYIRESNEIRLIIVDIKDGIGALDCDNAKLYIWNNVLGVFARFGGRRMLSDDSRVLNLQESRKQNRRKTKVYLKGIYVESHSMYQDSELLELIDIKGGKIGKSHISINRNEFTKEGLDYLEHEIYPVIIASAKAVLVELNEQAVLQEEKVASPEYKAFDKKIMESIENKIKECIEHESGDIMLLKRELEEMVLSAVGLSYFLRVLGKDKRLFCEKRGEQKEICKWDKLLNQIVKCRWEGRIPGRGNSEREMCEEQRRKFDGYINCGMMHKMKVYQYDELARTGVISEKKILDYASLLQETRKIAIISMRHNKYARWFYVPMLIQEQEEKGYYSTFQQKAQTVQEEIMLLEEMEHWADGIFMQLTDIYAVQRLHEEYGVDSDVQYALNYMLGNIPTVALYTNGSEDGDIRINVLSAESSGSVFCNKHMKRLILKKVHKQYTQYHAKRFITTAWRDYECIALKEIPSSVCVANGAYIAKQQTKRMLLPVLGENMGKLLHLTEQDFFKDIKLLKENCEKLMSVCNEYFEFYNKFKDVIGGNVKKEDVVEQEIYEYMRLEHILDEEQLFEFGRESGLIEGYWNELNQYVKKRIFDSMKSSPQMCMNYNEIAAGKPEKTEFQRMLVEDYFENVGLTLQENAELPKSRRQEIWDWFLKAVRFINKYRNIDLRKEITTHPKMESFKKSLWGREENVEESDVQKNIINYVLKNTQEQLSEKQIRNCYEKMMDDMIECVVENEVAQNPEVYSNIEAIIWK